MKKTKLVALGLAAVMVLGMVGCGDKTDKNESSESKKETTTTSESTSTSESTPAKEEPMKISMGIMQSSSVLDYEDNLLTNAIEEQMNVELEIMLLPNNSGDWGTKVTLMATSDPDSMPDMLMADGSIGSSMQLELGEAGVLTPIEDYVLDPEAMPHFNALSDVIKSECLAVMTQADGHIYGLADHTSNAGNNNPEKMFINTAWIEKLDLEVPTTTEELKEVLIAFRDGDPNGNKIGDEIGVYGRRAGWGEDTIACLMNSFTSWNNSKSNSGLALDQNDDKTVICPFVQDEWKEGLKYMADLYKEGVLAASIFTDDSTTYRATINLDPTIVGLVDMADNTWITTDEIRDQFTYFLPPKGPTGVSWLPARSPSFNVEVIFTCEGEVLEKCLEIQDAFYEDTTDPDSIRIISQGRGIYGEHWTDDPAIKAKTSNLYVEAGLDTEISYVNLKKKDQQTNYNWGKMHAGAPAGAVYNPYRNSGNYYDGVAYDFATASDAWKVDFFKAVEDPQYQPSVMPILQYTLEEKDEVGDARSDINTYMGSFLAECITGVKNVDKEWDAYVKEINKMGLDKWLEVAQRIYDRQTAN